ncbi:MAG: spermidine/putrescine ABC transporter ATP-binding protein PotA [Desulfovibrionaceae bacterium]
MKEVSNIIEMSDINKYYDSVHALDSVSLSILNGEFYTLLGPSGCGKTTILRMLAGFEHPTSGTISLNREIINDLPPEKRKVNTVFQDYALFPHMTVWNNVSFGLKMQKLDKDEIASRVEAILYKVALNKYATRYPHQLSGGQKQRVALARAAVNNPLVLLLDEPFSALDLKLRRQMQKEMKEFQRQLGITFVFVTHDQEEAFSLSDRIVVMNHGRIAQIGTPQEIYEEPANMFVAGFVGDINTLPAIVVEKKEKNAKDEGAYLVSLFGVLFPIKTKKVLYIGEAIKVMLRPEDLRIDSIQCMPEGQPFLEGIIEEAIYKGATVDLYIKLGNGERLLASEFFNEDDEDIDYFRGEPVAIAWVDGWEVILKNEE